MKVLFLGDVFGSQAIEKLHQNLSQIKDKYKIDFVIAQAENASGRKGLIPKDYEKLKKAGVDAFTMGNHVWAKNDIMKIINNNDIIRPYNVQNTYEGKGTQIFKIKNKTLRISQFLGITFNGLNNPWNQSVADNFFDSYEQLEKECKEDYHIIDFHAETTSEKKVFGLFLDGKVSAFVGTHTHVQTNDAAILPKGTAYITDVGMVGPMNSAIGASYASVYEKMRYNSMSRFKVSNNTIELNGVILTLSKDKNTIEIIKKIL